MDRGLRVSVELYNDQPAIERLDELTPRHREVARLMAAGQSNQEISDRLHISLSTVKQHVTSIYHALRLPPDPGCGSNRVLVARWCWEQER